MPFTIRDIENLTGIKAHTIRIWEQRYSFLKPKRSPTNIRFYTNEDLRIILNIAFLYKYGFKISHINKMSGEVMNEKILSLTSLEAKQERILNDLIQKMVDVDTDQFEAIIDKYITSSGIEKAISQIVFPFLEKIGVLWLTNHINPGQEHLVSNIIRQKLLVGIESIKTMRKSNKKICLFLREGEYHELCLLFIAFLLKKQGLSVIYLGASIPMNDVEFIVQLKNPDYIYTHMTTAGKNFNFYKFISDISKCFGSTSIIISGSLTHVYEKKLPPNIRFKKSLKEAVEFIESL